MVKDAGPCRLADWRDGVPGSWDAVVGFGFERAAIPTPSSTQQRGWLLDLGEVMGSSAPHHRLFFWCPTARVFPLLKLSLRTKTLLALGKTILRTTTMMIPKDGSALGV